MAKASWWFCGVFVAYACGGGPVALSALLIPPATLFAQNEALLKADGPAFDVVSIKLNKSGSQMMSGGYYPDGRYVMVNVPIANLIRSAYPAQSPALVGAPGWVTSEHYDIMAVAKGVPPTAQLPSMDDPPSIFTAVEEQLGLKLEPTEAPLQTLVIDSIERPSEN